MALRDYLAGEVAEDYADGFVSRREALRRLGLLGLGFGSASMLLAACGGDDDNDDASVNTTASATSSTAPAATTSSDRGAPVAETVTFAGPNGELQAAWAAPDEPTASVLVVHENRGLTPHFYDLASRLASDGYAALAVDLLSSQGGTAALTDPAAAPAALSAAPLEQLLGDLRAGIDEVERRAPELPIGVVGFCFGGAMTWNLLDAGESRLAAAVPFYGPAPEAPDFSGARAAVLAIYAGQDDRVNASRDRAVAALEAAGLTYEVRTFEGVDHAFFNDTGPRYSESAASEAYALLLDFFARHLA